MKFDSKISTAFVIISILILGYFGGWWDDFFSKPAAPERTLKPVTPSIDMSKIKLTGWSKTKKAWEIEAARIWQSNDGNYMYFEKITNGVVFSVKDKRVDFTADWARWEKMPEQLYLGGGLKAKVENGLLETETAVVKYRSEEMFCPKQVTYSKKDSWATADTLKINFSKEELVMEGNVELDQKNDQVKADQVIYNSKEEKFWLKGSKGITINP